MFKRLIRRRTAPGTVLGGIALFLVLGGVAYAATGGNFILGQSNSASSQTTLTANIAGKTLLVQNSNTGTGATALGLTVAAGKPPLTVNSGTKVVNLNGDKLDGLDSSAFVRAGVATTRAVTTAGGVVDVTNSGTTNGVQGRTGSPTASGVYGENTGTGGFGVAGRASETGIAIYGDNTGTGYAGYFDDKVHVGGNLELFGNLQCTGCVGAGDIAGKVDNADQLDGIDSTGFIQGGGKAAGQALAEAPGAHIFLGPPLLGFLRLSYACPANLANNGTLVVYNDSGSIANVFVESGGANPTYSQMATSGPSQQMQLPASASGDSFHIQAQGALGIMTIEAASVHRVSSNDCHAQAQALLTG